MDSGQLARPGSLRLHAAVDRADIRRGPGALERGRHLSFCRCLRRDGHHLPGMIRAYGDRVIRALQVAVRFCTDFFDSRLRDVFFVGPQRRCAGRLYLGRLARHDANVRVLSDL